MTRLIMLAILTASVLPAAAGENAFTLRQLPGAEAPAWNAGDPEPAWLQGAYGTDTRAPSMTRAVLYSLLVPGLGDYYAGRTYRARYFFIAEAAIWTSFAVFRIQGRQDEEAYQDFARRFAGIEGGDHSDDFYAEMREWNSSDEYEAFLKADGRPILFPDVGFIALEQYVEANRVADFEPWQWESTERRLQYAELRSASKAAYRHSMFSIAAAGVNRLVSAIFAYEAVKSYQEDSAQSRYRIEVTSPARYDAAVSIVRTF